MVKEARVIGLPVIGTRNGGLRDYIRHGENGYIVNPLDPITLATALSSLMQSSEHCIEMGNQHHTEDREAFSPKLCAAKFTAIYKELQTR